MSHTVKLGDRGRLVIPGEVRRRLGLAAGDRLVLTEREGVIRIEPLSDRIDALRGAFSELAPDRDLAGELVAERSAEAAGE